MNLSRFAVIRNTYPSGMQMLKLGAVLGGLGACAVFGLVLFYLWWTGSLTFGSVQ
jgi:hypothetical protein